MQDRAPPKPDLSIVLILRDPADSADPVLDALMSEPGIQGTEVILVDGRSNAEGSAWDNVVTISAPDLNMPQLKAIGVNSARGINIAFLEPKGVPAAGWLAAALPTDGQAKAALTGPVIYDGTGSAFDRAAFLFEYGAFSETNGSEEASDLAGNNMSLPAEELRSQCTEILEMHGLNKPFVQEALRTGGVSLRWAPGMIIRLRTKHRAGAFLKARFNYARCFGGVRSIEADCRKAWLYRIGTPAIPFLVFNHALRRSMGSPLLDFGGLLWLAVISVAWATGEIAGIWAGPGDSCSHLY